LKSQLHFLRVLKDATSQATRVLIASARHDSTKDIVDYAINTLNRNHKLTEDEKSKLQKYENRSRVGKPKDQF